jgi:hypothetical protein
MNQQASHSEVELNEAELSEIAGGLTLFPPQTKKGLQVPPDNSLPTPPPSNPLPLEEPKPTEPIVIPSHDDNDPYDF